MTDDRASSRRSTNSSTMRPSTPGASLLVKRVEEKVARYRDDPEALQELEKRITQIKQRPATAPPSQINYLKTNVAYVSVPLSQLDQSPAPSKRNLHPKGSRRPSSASCPGVGGSPTAREEYLAYSARRRSAASVRREKVKERRDHEVRCWYEQQLASADRSMLIRGRSAAERQLQQDAKECKEKSDFWHTIVALCYRLEAMREILMENRQKRAIFLREKEAAVKIATWFKAKLLERRHLFLIISCRQFQKFSTEAMQQYKKRIRFKCALRILDFMQKEVNTTRMMSAVNKLLRYTILIQRCWRSLVASREAQTALLGLQLTKFEGHLLTYNRKKATGNNANVFVATARKTCPLHEDLKMTLMRVTGRVRETELFSFSTTGIARLKRVKMEDEEDEMTPQQMLFLNTLTVRLPKPIKDQVVAERLAEEVRRFYHSWDRYIAEKKIYIRQKPIDDARLNLLRSAGIKAESQVVEPIRPKLRVLQSVNGLSCMMERGLRILINTNSEIANERRRSRTNMNLTQRRRS